MSIFSITGLSIKYPNSSHNNNSFELKIPFLKIQNNGLLSIVGKSGCGQSTFLNVLYGIVKPDQGTIKFLGKDIARMKDKEFSFAHSHDVSMVFQHYNLFEDLSAKENVILPLLIRGVKRKIASDKAEVLFKKFSLEHTFNQKASTLSGGEKQRVAILRSLIIAPKVILCDEPTGALDSKNSEVVMEMFKEISKDITIIMVSHNLELVNKYADRVITMSEGKIVDDKVINHTPKAHRLPSKPQKSKDNWNNIFVKNKFIKNKWRNVISFISSSFGFLSIFLSIGFTVGSKASQEAAISNNFGAGYATASIKSFYEIENSPLMYEKSVRPDLETLDEKLSIPSLKCELNLDYAFSRYPSLRYNDENYLNFEMTPIYDESQSLNEVIINEEMLKLFNEKKERILNKTLIISNDITFSINSDDISNPFIKDNITYVLEFNIKDVVKEFSFLNSPKIYYSYLGVKEFLKTQVLMNISRFKKESFSAYDFIDMASEDDVSTSYSYNLFVTDKSELDSFYSRIRELKDSGDPLQINSTSYEIKESYTSFINSFSNALFVFVIIAFIGVNFIIGMLSFSSFIESKKEAAILTCLGANNKSIISIYLKENTLIVLLSFTLALSLIFPFQLLINRIVSLKFGLENIISVPLLRCFNFPLLLPISILVISLIVVAVFVLVPLLFYRKIPLVNELKDE